MRAFCCRVIWTGQYYTLRHVIWTAILCRYVKLLTTFLSVALKHYAGKFYTWTEVLDTRVYSSHEQAEISWLFVGKFLIGPYYTMRRVIWTVTMRSITTFLSYILLTTTTSFLYTVRIRTTQASSTCKCGLRCSIWGCIVPASKVKFHDYL